MLVLAARWVQRQDLGGHLPHRRVDQARRECRPDSGDFTNKAAGEMQIPAMPARQAVSAKPQIFHCSPCVQRRAGWAIRRSSPSMTAAIQEGLAPPGARRSACRASCCGRAICSARSKTMVSVPRTRKCGCGGSSDYSALAEARRRREDLSKTSSSPRKRGPDSSCGPREHRSYPAFAGMTSCEERFSALLRLCERSILHRRR